MEHIHNNLMKLWGSLGNIPQKLKKLVIKTRYIFWTVVPFSRVQFIFILRHHQETTRSSDTRLYSPLMMPWLPKIYCNQLCFLQFFPSHHQPHISGRALPDPLSLCWELETGWRVQCYKVPVIQGLTLHIESFLSD
jgi:hypothetical protein